MKILFIHTKYIERGGEDSVVESEIELLKAHGYDVEVLYFNNGRHTFLNVLMMPYNLVSYFKTLRVLKRVKPDVVHMHNLHFAASNSVIWAISHLQIPIVRTLHNYRMLCPSGTLFHNNEIYLKSINADFPWHAVKDKVFRNSYILTFWLAFSIWIHKHLSTYQKINQYITLNEKSRSIFLSSDLKLKPSQVITKPNFINHSSFSLSPIRGDHFLYIGRLSPEKGISVMLKAFATNGLPLTIIGDGPMRDEVLKYQQQNPKINWLGYQNKEKIEAELHRCSALVMPSICLEGMPLSILESFSAGTPVIASKLGAMETIVDHNHNGLLFAPNDADSLNKQLMKWMSLSAREREEFSANAIQSYEDKYTPEKNLSALLSIYNTAVKRRKSIDYKPRPTVVL